MDDANTIGTAYLRAQTIAEPQRTRSLSALRSYNDLAIQVTSQVPGSTELRETSAQQGQLQQTLWRLAGEAMNARPRDSAPRLYVDSLNAMIDQQGVRLAGLNNRVPNAVLWLELLGAAIALGLLGLYLSVLGRGLVPIIAAAVVVSTLVLVTFDLDRPIDELGILEDTLVYLIIGDNGASAEGTPHGCFNEIAVLNGAAALESTEFMVSRIDDFGTPAAYNHYAVGWAHATDTPYQWTKQVASHWGGTRNGTIVHWPNGITAKGEVRSQFHHVIDVAPTVLEAAGLPEPRVVHGVEQKPIEGVSMAYSFDEASADERRTTQYFEMLCNRGIYDHGWTAVTRHSIPWVFKAEELPFADDTWELYDTNADWSQAHDLAAEMPEKLEELKTLFMEEARKYNVLPLDDRRVERFNSDLAGRPVLIRGTSQLLFAGMRRLTENVVINTKNKSHSITAEIHVPDGGVEGVIVSQGGAFAGWSLYVINGRLKYWYNLLGLQSFAIEGNTEIPPGTHQVRVGFAYDGGGLGKGATVTLYLDGAEIGEGRVEATVPMLFSTDETCDVGTDTASPVSDDYTPETSRFTGKIKWVQIDIAEAAEDLDNLITPEERLKIALTRQ